MMRMAGPPPAAHSIAGAPGSVPPAPIPRTRSTAITAQTLPDEPNFCFVPACDLEADVQQIRIVIEGMAGHVPTALVALTMDDALNNCDKLNRRLGYPGAVRGGRHALDVGGLGLAGAAWYQCCMSRIVGNRAVPEAAAAQSRGGSRAGGCSRRACVAAIMLATAIGPASGTAGAGDRYLRGGIGFDRPGEAVFSDTDCSSTSPASLYGCGTGGDGARLRSAGEFGTVPAVELGLGYATGAVRVEALVEYRPDFAFEGRANFLAPDRRQEVSAKLSSVSGMLAGFVDLAALGLPRPGPFAPFVGAGIGVAHTRIGKTVMTFPKTITTVPGGRRTGLAWMATAGVAVGLGGPVTLDLAWRYSDLGKIRTARGPGRVVWRDGSREPLPLDLAPTEARLKGHGVRLSLRYAF